MVTRAAPLAEAAVQNKQEMMLYGRSSSVHRFGGNRVRKVLNDGNVPLSARRRRFARGLRWAFHRRNDNGERAR